MNVAGAGAGAAVVAITIIIVVPVPMLGCGDHQIAPASSSAQVVQVKRIDGAPAVLQAVLQARGIGIGQDQVRTLAGQDVLDVLPLTATDQLHGAPGTSQHLGLQGGALGVGQGEIVQRQKGNDEQGGVGGGVSAAEGEADEPFVDDGAGKGAGDGQRGPGQAELERLEEDALEELGGEGFERGEVLLGVGHLVWPPWKTWKTFPND